MLTQSIEKLSSDNFLNEANTCLEVKKWVLDDGITQHLIYLREWEFAEIHRFSIGIDDTVRNDAFIELKIKSHLKHCVDCGRLSPFQESHTYLNTSDYRYVWRLCWEHLSDDGKYLLELLYDLEGRNHYGVIIN